MMRWDMLMHVRAQTAPAGTAVGRQNDSEEFDKWWCTKFSGPTLPDVSNLTWFSNPEFGAVFSVTPAGLAQLGYTRARKASALVRSISAALREKFPRGKPPRRMTIYAQLRVVPSRDRFEIPEREDNGEFGKAILNQAITLAWS
jgi:hypothetical protein